MAEAILRRQIEERGIKAEILSRGLAAPVGRRPHRNAIEVCAARGMPISSSKHAALLTAFEVRIASRILVMEEAHQKLITKKYPAAEGKTFRMDHYAPTGDIADPVRSPKSVFLEMWDQMNAYCSDWADALAAEQTFPERAIS